MSKVITEKYNTFNEADNSLGETLFHNANGYIGVRGALEEGVPAAWDTMRGMYINGFYDVIPMKQAEMLCNFVDKKETMLNVADTMTICCIVDGEWLDLTKGIIIEHTRTLDMERGVTVRRLIWESPEGKQVEITSTRMTSFEMLSLFSIEYNVKALNFEGDIRIISTHKADVTNYCNPNDPRLAAESLKNIEVLEMGLVDDISLSVSETSVSGLRMCSAVYNKLTKIVNGEMVDCRTEIIDNQGAFSITCHLMENAEMTLTKYSVFSDSVRCRDIKSKALEDIKCVIDKGLEYYYDKQKKYLKEFWTNCEMEIDGDDAMNNAVAFNMYQMLQSSAKDEYASIAAKGMSGEGYEGHYFWDTETFIMPFFIMTNPSLADRLLRYRHKTLDKARINAGLLGHKKGALFPWRTITGTECSGYFVSGSAAYHINADIAYACISYYLTTGNIDFMEEIGEEILIETARLWMDLGNYNSDGKFVLNAVTGPDEYTCMINNNYYTNIAASYNLKWAVKMYEILKEKGREEDITKKLLISDEELSEMMKASENMLLLYDEKLGINPQDDSFLSKPVWDIENTPKSDFPLLLHYHPLMLYRYQVCKQADTVLAYFMFEDGQDKEVMKRSFEYYEKITTHDSSLSTCVFSIVASRMGFKEKAYGYFGDSAKLDLENRHNNTKHGIHTANMGGCYMAIVNGFAGVRITEEGISCAPFVPGDWTGYRFKLVYMGNLIGFDISKENVKVSLVSGEGIPIKVFDEIYTLTKNAKIVVNI